MANGDAELAWMIERLKLLPELAKEIAPAVSDAVRVELEATARAGTDPLGKPWAPRQEDGKRAMVNAVDALAVAPVGRRVVCVVRGPEALHHRGTSKGGVRRSIIPRTSSIPPKIESAVRPVLDAAFVEHMSK